jgi:hypothetical protein
LTDCHANSQIEQQRGEYPRCAANEECWDINLSGSRALAQQQASDDESTDPEEYENAQLAGWGAGPMLKPAQVR